jgi:catechol 2,3-dioxygenase-like lactoylglutathione lyase family enzyme
MTTPLAHIQLNIDFKNISFYKDLFTFLGWQPIMEMDHVCGLTTGSGCDVWFVQAQKPLQSDYDNFGMNHLGFKATSIFEVDAATKYLSDKGINALFDTPRHRPEFSGSPDETYYQVMFETPDRLLFEIVYTGKK